MANTLIQEINRIFLKLELNQSCSIGIAMCREGETFESAYRKADRALYDAKMEGKNQFCWYTEETNHC